MAFTRYASLESAQVLDLKGSSGRAKHASLDKLSEFDNYRTEDGFLYARIRAISSRVNRNNDGWPSIELAGGEDIFNRHLASEGGFTVEADANRKYGYSTFLGKPIFVDHHNSNPERARGVIVDAKLHVEDHKTAASLDPYYATAPSNHCPPTWVELLLEVDAKSFPRLAKAIIEGSKDSKRGIDGFSMGCNVEKSVCNICKNAATSPEDFCKHIKLKGMPFSYFDEHGRKQSARSYEDCYGIQFFEISAVFDPADETALLREVRSNYPQEMDAPILCPECFGENPACPTCQGNRRIIAPVSGSDGYITPSNLGPEAAPPHALHDVALGPKRVGGMDDQGSSLTPHDILEGTPDRSAPNSTFPGNWTDQTRVQTEQKIRQVTEQAEQMLKSGTSPEQAAEMMSKFLTASGVAPDVRDQIVNEWLQTAVQYSDQSSSGLTVPQEFPPFSGTPQEYLSKFAAWAAAKIAQNPPPQGDLVHAPEKIDTLRKEQICDVCGATMDSETCDRCGYVKPPEGFDNPDLSKAKDVDLHQEQNPEEEKPDQEGSPHSENAALTPTNDATLAHVTTSKMGWSIEKTAGKINPVERPLTPGPKKPRGNGGAVIKDQAQPVTSSVRNAEEFFAATGATTRSNMETHTADAASGAPEVAKPDVNVDVTGVGGVTDASNEAASQAEAQVDVLGVGGTGVEGVAADKTENVEKGNEHSKNIEAIPTKTFDDGSSAVERQEDPVTSEVFPEDGVHASSWTITALDDSVFPADDGGLAGGSTVKGVDPVDPVGKAQDRVDVLEHVTSPGNNSGPTTTWSGTDGNGVLRQQEPVTTEPSVPSTEGVKSSAHLFSAFKLADLEIELGLLPAEKKYERVAELEAQPPSVVAASLTYAKRVKTAGLSKKAKTARRLPVLGRNSSVEKEATDATSVDDLPDSALFS